MATRTVFKHYFDNLVFFLKVGGLWLPSPDAKTTFKVLYHMYNGFWFCSQYLHVVPSEFVTAISSENMDESIRRLRDFGNHLIVFLKAVNWYIWQKDLIPLVDTMKNHEVDYEDCDTFKPLEIVALHKGRGWKWITFLGGTISFLFTCMLISSAVEIFFEREMLIKAVLPTSIILPVRNDTIAIHAATTFFMFWQFALPPYTIVFLDGFFVIATAYMAAQFRVLSGALRTLWPRSLDLAKQEQDDLQYIMNRELRKCIRHLQFIYSISARLEEFFTHQVTIQIILSWTQVCFCLYFAISDDLSNGIGNLSYLLGVLLELFIYCSFGDDVIIADAEVREAFYQCHWEESDQKFQKAVQFSMIRLSRPVQITASKLTPLSLQLFLTVIRGGYSLFTLLQR